MVANHGSHLDALTLAAALPRRMAANAFALAAGDTFFTNAPVAAFAAYAVNALPVWRRRTTAADLDALRTRLVEDRAVLILFPEGTRTRDGTMGPFRSGVGALVAGTSVPVVPCCLAGALGGLAAGAAGAPAGDGAAGDRDGAAVRGCSAGPGGDGGGGGGVRGGGARVGTRSAALRFTGQKHLGCHPVQMRGAASWSVIHLPVSGPITRPSPPA